MANPKEIAQAALFILSDRSAINADNKLLTSPASVSRMPDDCQGNEKNGVRISN
jgi:hypothetical protein